MTVSVAAISATVAVAPTAVIDDGSDDARADHQAYIDLSTDEPGIRGLFRFRPETALPLNQLCDALMCGESTLTRGERELIAAYVSSLNQCTFCFSTHAAFAALRL